MEVLLEILDKVYQMTAISNIADNPMFLVMYLLAFVLLIWALSRNTNPCCSSPSPLECSSPTSPAVRWA